MIVQDVEALVAGHCKPCEGGVEKYTPAEVETRLKSLPGWRPTEGATRIRKDWRVKNFMAGIEFFTKVAELAQAEGHHPDLHLEGYRECVDRALDPCGWRPVGERFHSGCQDRPAAH